MSTNKINRQPKELNEKFFEQVALLTLACRNFDEGYEYASLHIAVSLRTLLHDGKNGISILSHIGKRGIKFLDTSLNAEQEVNLGLASRLRHVAWNAKDEVDLKNSTVSYVPLCKGYSEEEILKRIQIFNWKTIDDWLKVPICINTNYPNATLNRFDLIKITADRDGGAHLDETIEEKYDHFRFGFKGLSEKNWHNWKDGKILNIPIYPILRQIAFEVLFSFKNVGLIRRDMPIVWDRDIELLNHMINSLSPHYGYWISMAKRLKLFQPDKIKDKFSDQ